MFIELTDKYPDIRDPRVMLNVSGISYVQESSQVYGGGTMIRLIGGGQIGVEESYSNVVSLIRSVEPVVSQAPKRSWFRGWFRQDFWPMSGGM